MLNLLFFSAMGAAYTPRLPGGVALLAPMHGSRHIVQIGPLRLLAMNTNLPLVCGRVVIRRGPMVGLQLVSI